MARAGLLPQQLGNDGKLGQFRLYTYHAGTNSTKITFADAGHTIKNSQPVDFPANGDQPDTFYDGNARRRMTQIVNGVEVERWELDNVTGSGGGSGIENFVGNTTYAIQSLVLANDEKYYRSLVNNNLANDPANNANPTKWRHFVFSEKLQPLSGGGVLVGMQGNILNAAGTYTMPAANSIFADEWLMIKIPASVAAIAIPVVNMDGLDTYTTTNGPETSIDFDTGREQVAILVSDGVSKWK